MPDLSRQPYQDAFHKSKHPMGGQSCSVTHPENQLESVQSTAVFDSGSMSRALYESAPNSDFEVLASCREPPSPCVRSRVKNESRKRIVMYDISCSSTKRFQLFDRRTQETCPPNWGLRAFNASQLSVCGRAVLRSPRHFGPSFTVRLPIISIACHSYVDAPPGSVSRSTRVCWCHSCSRYVAVWSSPASGSLFSIALGLEPAARCILTLSLSCMHVLWRPHAFPYGKEFQLPFAAPLGLPAAFTGEPVGCYQHSPSL